MSNNSKNHFKYITLLIVTYCVLLCSGDLLGARLMLIGSIPVSAGSFITSSNYVLSDLITDVYGYRYGRQLIWLGIFSTILFAATNQLLNAFPAPSYWHSKDAFDTVFNISARTAVAYITAILLGDFLNIYILSKWKILAKGRLYLLRVITCSIIGESIYVMVFYIVLFIGALPFAKFGALMLSSLMTKIIFGSVVAIPTRWIASALKKSENYDAYDFGEDYNPFNYFVKNKMSEH